MKNMKKVVSILLALAMVFAMNFTTAFAAEAPETSTVPVEVAATSDDDEGIMPLIWDQFTADIPANSNMTLSGYIIPERYMAFECKANVKGGGTNSGTYAVHLLQDGGKIAGTSHRIDGITYKVDKIDLEATNTSCGFRIYNYSNVDITVTITFYSWN